jgi:hypothetical protein
MTRRVDEVFHVAYGNKLDMNKMKQVQSGGVAFVGRRGSNQGVSGYVAPVPGIAPYPAGLLTVALGGTRLLSTYVQQQPFYTAQNVAVLTPLDDSMTLTERHYYALCIKHNAFRHGAFGREANRTLASIALPDAVPHWIGELSEPAQSPIPWRRLFPTWTMPSCRGTGNLIRVDDLFHLRYGHSLELNRLTRTEAPAGVNFIGRSAMNNGVTARVLVPPDVQPGITGELTVALGGSVLSTFVQPEPFLTAFHVMILTPKESDMSVAERFWWAHCIAANQYRYSYGRQANRTLGSIRLPTSIPAYASGLFEELAGKP